MYTSRHPNKTLASLPRWIGQLITTAPARDHQLYRSSFTCLYFHSKFIDSPVEPLSTWPAQGSDAPMTSGTAKAVVGAPLLHQLHHPVGGVLPIKLRLYTAFEATRRPREAVLVRTYLHLAVSFPSLSVDTEALAVWVELRTGDRPTNKCSHCPSTASSFSPRETGPDNTQQ